jgi:hypothetical protein
VIEQANYEMFLYGAAIKRRKEEMTGENKQIIKWFLMAQPSNVERKR